MTTNEILKGIKEQKYDIGFCSKINDEPLIEFIPVAKQDLVVIVPPDHPLASKSEIHLEETLEYKQIIYKSGSGLRHIIDHLFDQIGAYPDVSYEIAEDHVVAGFVANGFGIAVAPDIPIIHSLNLKVLPLVSPTWQRNFYMATLKDAYRVGHLRYAGRSDPARYLLSLEHELWLFARITKKGPTDLFAVCLATQKSCRNNVLPLLLQLFMCFL